MSREDGDGFKGIGCLKGRKELRKKVVEKEETRTKQKEKNM